MKNNNKFGGIAQKMISTVFFLVTFIFLLYLYLTIKYLPFFLGAMIVILPAAVNLLLHLFACEIPTKKPEKKALEEGTKKIKKFLLNVLHGLKLCVYGIAFAYNKAHKILQMVFVLGAFVGVQIAFGMMLTKLTTIYNPLSFIQPIVFVILFVGAIIVDKWIKHSEASNERTEAFFHNSRVFLYLTKLTLLLLAIATTIKLLNLAELQTYLYYALIVVFYYASVLILISLVVSFVKKELTTKPKIIIPLPFAGKDKNDLSVLSFLENNTGITMRGLWSMKLIKQIIPYTIIAIAALFWLSTSVVQVGSNQQAVLYRFGELQNKALDPGLHFTLPAPFDNVVFYDVETINNVSIGYTAKENTDNLWTGTHGSNEHKLLLGDGAELVSVNLKIEYKIDKDNLKTYINSAVEPVKILEANAYELITQRIIGTDLQTLLTMDRAAFVRSFEKDLMEEIKEADIGLEIVNIIIESIHPPLEIAAKYEEVINAEIDAEKILTEANRTAEISIINAKANKESAINSAMANYHAKVADATASVSEFMASVEANKSNSEAYHYYKYLDALTQSYGKANLVLVGDGVDSSKIYFGNFANGSLVTSNTNSGTTVTDPTDTGTTETVQ